jgi:hypothetical protein
MSVPAPSRPSRALRSLPLALAGMTFLLFAAGRDPRAVGPTLVVAAVLLAPVVIGRWRMRRLLVSGDVERVIGTWEGSIARIAHAETMAPLLRATAYAAYGWLEPARRAMDRAVKGAAWDAAVEQRLFVETLLDAFEGRRDDALRKARELEALPNRGGGLMGRRRVASLRRGLSAFARAFTHESLDGDARVLSRAAGASPLVYWAMRYAEAIVAIDRGRASEVAPLLAGAPQWPRESAFQEYHHELLAHAGG